MDAPAPAPDLPVEDARSPVSPDTAKSSRADRRHQPHPVPMEVAPLRGHFGDVVYTGVTARLWDIEDNAKEIDDAEAAPRKRCPYKKREND